MRKTSGFMIVIGGSAGGLNAACRLLGQLHKEIKAVIVVILHLPEKGESPVLNSRLQTCTSLPCEVARDRMAFKPGHVYMAPAGYHLLIGKKEFLYGHGPAEGGWRPSVDTSFRSAAAAWDSRCIGVVLSGLLNDGTAGMEAIKRCGGRTIVQDPDEAEYPNMPLSVVQNVNVDVCIRLGAMGKAIEAAARRRPKAAEVPEGILLETRLAERASSGVEEMSKFSPSVYSCPECGGVLWQMKGGKLAKYRCHIGHQSTEPQLARAQEKQVEETMWVALRTLEERTNLLKNMAAREEKQGFRTMAESHHAEIRDLKQHIGRMKELIDSVQTAASD